ncbi:hypothetical protein PV383_38475 [Streptomyces caniscabiei]|uniref:Secreted protein n=1 Tax=Streptomyces caniscabiei TaxID=2746961 RepID=A0ABU4N3E5_9ACTN|nr:hypothetical protein [Streptomyces caniscabiei]MDX2946820.1 hypothetical protein [Streptomyces caniscabiei]MDX3043024.1 hypothetical protein [Streptomyces caniscabiei]
MAFPTTPLIVTISLFLGGSWVDITADVYNRDKIAIVWGRQDWASTADSTRCSLTLNNGQSKAAPGILGRYSRRNPRSDLFGLLGLSTLVAIDLTTPAGTVVGRFEGYITSWPTKWDLSGNDVYTTVTATGIKRRLIQGTKALKDALRRHISTAAPIRYWPLTDGERAREGSEVAVGGQPVRAIGSAGSFYQGQPDWGKGSLAPWLEPSVQLPANTEGTLTVKVPPMVLTGWTADHYRAGPGSTPDDFTIFDTGAGTDADPLVAWIIESSRTANNVVLSVLSAGETLSSIATVTTVASPGIFDESLHMIRLTTAANGSSTNWTLVIDGVTAASGTYAIPHRPVSRFRYRWGAFASLADPMTIGHITYWGTTVPRAVDTWQAANGYDRELAGRRIERLCAEQGVPLMVNGNLDQTLAMGPQKPGAFLDLVQSAADVDGGVVYEARDTAGLAYRTRRSKYNQGV